MSGTGSARALALLAGAALALAGGSALGRAPAALAGGRPAPSHAATSGTTLPAATLIAAPQDLESLNAPYDGKLHFVRVRYAPMGGRGFGRGRGGREPMWAHDYPRAERNFMKIVRETTFVDPLLDASNILTLDDPRLFLYPIAYIVEVGAWNPTEEEARGLGEYLRKGGFLIVDDFRDYRSLANLQEQMGRVLPGAQLVELDGSHEIFDSFFRIDPNAVIPPYGPQTPVWYGIFEDNDRARRLMAIVNYDNDIAEYWEYSDLGYFPIELSNEAYKLGVNYIVYGMTH